jgi:hypothetical protein
MNLFYFLGLLALLLVPLLQIVLASFSGSFLAFNSVIVVLVFLLMLARPESSIYFIIASGLILDMHAQTGFGIFSLALTSTALVVYFLYLNFFTNRSLYSLLLLVLIGTIVFHFAFIGVTGSYYLLGWHNSMVALGYWKSLIADLIGNITISFIAFVIINRYSNLFKPTYLQS